MKFEIHIMTGPEAKRKFKTLRGFGRLEDACAAAVGLLAVYRADTDFVSIWLAKSKGHTREHIHGLKLRWNESLESVLAGARRTLAAKIAEQAAKDARWQWLRPWCDEIRDAFTLINENPEMNAAFFRNDFAPIDKWLRETHQPKIAI